MKKLSVIFALFGLAFSQQYSWLNLHSCNSCFGPGVCFSEESEVPKECGSCIQSTCETQLQLQTLANEGLSCLQRAWNSPNQCQKVCPLWSFYHYWRSLRCRACLTPCIGTMLNSDVGQCQLKEIVGVVSDPCVSETKGKCGSCYRANRCYTERELSEFGGICKAYIELKCPDKTNVTCISKAFSDPCSSCPSGVQAEGRFQACEVCLDRCKEKEKCIMRCRKQLPKYPVSVPCPMCRGFCKVNPNEKDCESRCDCDKCDSCFQSCRDLDGDDFNLFNPCRCLNTEETAPVMVVQRGRVLGGANSCKGDWPWIAYIYEVQPGRILGGICGGTLLNNKWIITAAHCFRTVDPSLYGVVFGEHNVNIQTSRVIRSVKKIVLHPFFDTFSYDYDVALAELNDTVPFNKYIKPLAIAPPGTPTDNTKAPTFAGSLCKTAGWGQTFSPNGRRSPIQMQLTLHITPRILCESFTTTGYDQGKVAPGAPKFCAGGIEGEDTCKGDSGGPLFCLQADGTYLLHGITSYGTPVCGQEGKPGVYTRIADVSTWINLCTSVNKCSI